MEDAREHGELAVYFDGACHLCSREVAHYQRIDLRGALAPVDIAAPDFDAAALGLDPVAVNRALHVRLPTGELRTGVDAFVEIWRRLPSYRWLARVASVPVLRPLLDTGYWVFARIIRPALPKRRCAGGTCRA